VLVESDDRGRGTYSMKYKTTMMMIIVVVVVVVPCPLSLSLVPHCRPGPLSSVCVACVRSWALAVICGLWWVVVVGRGSFFGGGSCFCVLAIICVHFGGFVIVSGWSWAVVFDGGPLVSTWWQGGHWSSLGASLVWW